MTVSQTASTATDEQIATLLRWVDGNSAMMSGVALVRAVEAADRRRVARAWKPAEVRGASALRTYLEHLRARRRRRLRLDEPARQAPWNVSLVRTLPAEHLGMRYEVEVLDWDQYPGMRATVNVYRPVGRPGERFPVVLAPLACQTHLASHDAVQSVQRLCANLALDGFLTLAVADGLCFNGEIGERLENGSGFEQYGRLSGSGLGNEMIGLMVLSRALDYLVSRDDVDALRIAMTGYSYGGVMSLRFAELDPRIAAVGIAATSISTEDRFTAGTFSYRRHAAMYSGAVDLFVTSGTPPTVFHEAEPEEMLSPPWSELGDLVLLPPRAFFIAQGREDPGTSASATRLAIERLSQVYAMLGMPTWATFDLVAGSHNYDSARRRVVSDWLIQALGAKPLLPPPIDEPEYETPLFEREQLEVRGGSTASFREIHASVALATIEEQRPRVGVSALPPETARRRIREIVMMPTASPSARPILIDDRAFTTGATGVIGRYWLLPLADDIDAAAVTLVPEDQTVASGVMAVRTDGRVPPDLVAHAASGHALMVVFPPGFGPFRSTQDKLGRFAVRLPLLLERTLLGLGIETVERALDLFSTLFGSIRVEADADGVDAGNILAFAAALDDRISSATIRRGVATFRRFLTSPTPAIPAPTLAVPGIAAYVDIDDLVSLAAPRRLEVASESDLTEFVLDLRPARP
jgi:hypothetical protein